MVKEKLNKFIKETKITWVKKNLEIFEDGETGIATIVVWDLDDENKIFLKNFLTRKNNLKEYDKIIESFLGGKTEYILKTDKIQKDLEIEECIDRIVEKRYRFEDIHKLNKSLVKILSTYTSAQEREIKDKKDEITEKIGVYDRFYTEGIKKPKSFRAPARGDCLLKLEDLRTNRVSLEIFENTSKIIINKKDEIKSLEIVKYWQKFIKRELGKETEILSIEINKKYSKDVKEIKNLLNLTNKDRKITIFLLNSEIMDDK